MRHLIAVASVAATLTLLISTPVTAQTTMHGGDHVVGHHHRAAVDPFNRFAGFDGFGGWGWGGDWSSGGWVDYDGTLQSAEPPAGDFGALPPPAPRSPAELPRCHEATSVGVVIERGVGCAH